MLTIDFNTFSNPILPHGKTRIFLYKWFYIIYNEENQHGSISTFHMMTLGQGKIWHKALRIIWMKIKIILKHWFHPSIMIIQFKCI
jgi:hypothetical protein